MSVGFVHPKYWAKFKYVALIMKSKMLRKNKNKNSKTGPGSHEVVTDFSTLVSALVVVKVLILVIPES